MTPPSTREAAPLTRSRRFVRRVGAAAAIAAAVVTLGAPPAAAHGAASDDAPASNYRSVVTDTPEVAGVTVRTVEAGSQLEVINAGDEEIVVFDYDGRPYLRIGPDGVLENQNSPAVYLNQSSDASALVPDGVGEGPPEWQRVSGEPSYRWHDHRAHWMGGNPPLVTARPDQRQTVAEWTVPMGIGDRRVEVEGITEWVPAPSPLPWVALATGTAAVVIALALRRRVAAALLVATIAITLASVAIVAGSWNATAEAAIGKLPMLAMPFFVVTMLIGAVFLARSRPNDALILGAGAGGITALLTLLTSGDWFTRSQLPTELPSALARTVVAVSIGAGTGLAVAATWLIGRPLLSRPAAEPAATEPALGSDDDGPAADGVDGTSRADDEADARTPAVPGVARMRRTLLVGFAVTVIAVGVTAQLAIGGSDTDQSGIAAICRGVTSAPDDSGEALRDAFAGPAHDSLHDLAAQVQERDRSVAGDLLRAKQQIEAALTDADGDVDPGPALPAAIRRASATMDIAAPQDCTLEPS